MQKPALYFPYVHIRDDEWLKAAALYWPSVHRLVPHGYAKHDSATAQVFVDEEILQDEEPGKLLGTAELGTAEWDLSRALSDNAELLVDQFSVERARTDWDGRCWAEAGGPDWELPALGWIHATKFPPDVAKLLSSKGLAARGCREMNGRDPGHPEDWLGLHPALAGAYMTALAARLSAKAHFEPLTDQADLRIASPRTDIRAALSLLLGQSTETGQRGPARGVENYVMLALHHARPANLDSVPAKKIVSCRKSLAVELEAFRAYVSDQQAELAELAAIPHERRRIEAFADHVERTVEVPLRQLEKGMRLHKLQPTRSLLLAGALAPPATVDATLHATGAAPAVIAATGVVVGIGAAWWQVKDIRTAAKKSSPVAFLLDMRDELTPRTLAARSRRFLRGSYGRT